MEISHLKRAFEAVPFTKVKWALEYILSVPHSNLSVLLHQNIHDHVFTEGLNVIVFKPELPSFHSDVLDHVMLYMTRMYSRLSN